MVDPAEECQLRSEQDSRAFFPDAGHFNLQDAHLLFGAVLGVEGPNLPLRWHTPLYFQCQQPGIQANRILCLCKILAYSPFWECPEIKLGIFPIS